MSVLVLFVRVMDVRAAEESQIGIKQLQELIRQWILQKKGLEETRDACKNTEFVEIKEAYAKISESVAAKKPWDEIQKAKASVDKKFIEAEDQCILALENLNKKHEELSDEHERLMMVVPPSS